MKNLLILLLCSCGGLLANESTQGLPMELSDYVTIVFTAPESYAQELREVMWKAGAGKIGDYSHSSFSIKGTSHFLPHAGSNPFIGQEGALEELIEERIETVCHRDILENVLEEIKKAHPYEEMVIDIYPIYERARKKAKTQV